MNKEKIDKMIEILKFFKEGKELEGKVYDKPPGVWRGIIDLDLEYQTTDTLWCKGFENIREKPTRIPSWEELISIAEKKTLLFDKFYKPSERYIIHGLLPNDDAVILRKKDSYTNLYIERKRLFGSYTPADDMPPDKP